MKHDLGLIYTSSLLPVSYWLCGNILGLLHKVSGSNNLFYINILLLNSLSSVKTFDQNLSDSNQNSWLDYNGGNE